MQSGFIYFYYLISRIYFFTCMFFIDILKKQVKKNVPEELFYLLAQYICF